VKNRGKIAWSKFHDYLLSLGACRTVRDFIRTASGELETLIPFDTFVGFHTVQDARCLDLLGASESLMAQYNDYYRTKQPGMLATDRERLDPSFMLAVTSVKWQKYSEWEYASDFMIPNSAFKTIARSLPGHQVALSIHRSRFSPDFTHTDIKVLGLINQHLNLYWSLLNAAGSYPSGEEIKDRFRALTTREAELCSLLVFRLSNNEIASRLFISPRTVEKHVETIFEKLYVRSREQLRLKLASKK